MIRPRLSLTNVLKSESIYRILNIKCPFTYRAHEQFINAVQAGDDGRPDWIARKSCNYMTSAVEVSFHYIKLNSWLQV